MTNINDYAYRSQQGVNITTLTDISLGRVLDNTLEAMSKCSQELRALQCVVERCNTEMNKRFALKVQEDALKSRYGLEKEAVKIWR